MVANAASVAALANFVQTKLASLSQEAAEAVSPAPGRVVLVAPGAQVAWDNCCDGQVWARLGPVTPSDRARVRGPAGSNPCAVPFFETVAELGIIRCAAVSDSQGNPPSPAQLTANGQQGINDMAALLGVLRCTDDLESLLSWTPVGPEGGCFGGYWSFRLLIPNSITCGEE